MGLCLLLLALVPANARAADTERAAAKLFERLKDRPPALRVFLQALPIGTDDEGVLRSDMSHEFMRAAWSKGSIIPR